MVSLLTLPCHGYYYVGNSPIILFIYFLLSCYFLIIFSQTIMNDFFIILDLNSPSVSISFIFLFNKMVIP